MDNACLNWGRLCYHNLTVMHNWTHWIPEYYLTYSSSATFRITCRHKYADTDLKALFGVDSILYKPANLMIAVLSQHAYKFAISSICCTTINKKFKYATNF